MKFIFPQNYHFKNKIFGFIDYTTAIVNICWCSFILVIINLIFHNINVKIFIFILTSFPLLLFSFSGFNGENILNVFTYITKFVFNQKIYFYDKNRKKI